MRSKINLPHHLAQMTVNAFESDSIECWRAGSPGWLCGSDILESTVLSAARLELLP